MADNPLSVIMPPAPNQSAGAYIMLEPPHDEDDMGIEDADDGGAIVSFGEEEPEAPAPSGDFYENLADGVLPDLVTDRIAQELLDLIDEDKKAREPRDKQYDEGLQRTGMGKNAPGGADFEGASKVAHPMLQQACIDFEARIIKELWPPGQGPVRPNILGKVTEEKQDKADRKAAFMNYQLGTLMKEARPTMEATLTQVPMGGVQYVKLWWDHRLKRPRMQFVPVDKVYLPASAANYTSAHRRTFSEMITNVEYLQRIKTGQYRDKRDASPPSTLPSQSKSEETNDKIAGVDKTDGTNVDSEREIYEATVYLEVTDEMAESLGIEQEGDLCPYLVSIDVQNRTILAMYRDWEEDDPAMEAIDHLFEYDFIPWRGAQAIGLPQIIGGLAAASTGSLRALLDSALASNMQGGYVLKGTGTSGQNVNPKPGEILEIGTSLETDDIRKKILPFSTNQPSEVLFKLLGALVDFASGAVRTSLDETAIDTNANTPVGTQLSRVEEGLVVFSAIHGRIHTDFDRMLAGLHRLNRLYLPEALTLDVKGEELFISRADFEGPPDIQPVSEPTIFSDQQRFSQIMAVKQSAMTLPQLYNLRAIEMRLLKLWKVPNPEELLPEPPKPTELNAINENLAMAFGKPVTVFPEQDHLAHLQVHLDFGKSPVLGANPILAPKFLPGFLQHCAEHMVYHYVQMNHDLVSNAAGLDASKLFSPDPELKRQMDRLLAMASMATMPETEATFKGVMPVLQQSMQMLKSMMPPPPMDPAQAAVQAASAETHRKTVDDARDAMLESHKVAAGNQKDAIKAALDREKIAAAERTAKLNNQTKLMISAADNQTARDIEAASIAAGAAERHFKNGESITP